MVDEVGAYLAAIRTLPSAMPARLRRLSTLGAAHYVRALRGSLGEDDGAAVVAELRARSDAAVILEELSRHGDLETADGFPVRPLPSCDGTAYH